MTALIIFMLMSRYDSSDSAQFLKGYGLLPVFFYSFSTSTPNKRTHLKPLELKCSLQILVYI
jgi:hypothetical protein